MELVNISIIVPTRNNSTTIRDCIESLINLDFPKENLEIIVSDGMSHDGTREIVKELIQKDSRINMLNNTQLNSAAGRTIAIKKAKYELIAFTDSDCIVEKDWLNKLLEAFNEYDSDKLAGIGGPNIPPKNSNTFTKAIGYALSTKIGSLGSVQGFVYNKGKKVESVANCNALIKKKIIEEVNFYDTAFPTGQDAEINFRIRKKGYEFIFTPHAVVWHRMRSTPLKFFKRMIEYGSARIKIMKTHPDSFKIIYILPIIAFLAMLGLLFVSISNLTVRFVFFAILVLYGLMILSSANIVCVKKNLKLKYFLLIPLVLFLEHSGYLLGELKGIITRKK